MSAIDHRAPVSAESTTELRHGALGAAASIILATASAAPAYSLAATIAWVVALVGFQAPAVVVIAFVPILFVSFGYAALNAADPDCGTIFTWGTRVFGPRTGFLGGWAIIASFVLVMGSLAQVAGQYVFLLFGANSIGADASSPWVLLVGLGWIALMTMVCYRGIEVAAAVQRAMLYLEFAMLVVFSVIALVKVYAGHAGTGSVHPSLSWFNPFAIGSVSDLVSAVVMMLFIYWGWETAVTVNEETADQRRIPGLAAIVSTVVLLLLFLAAFVATLAFAGIGTTGVGLGNPDNFGDVFSGLGHAVFGDSGLGNAAWHLLLLMVLTSAAASAETTVLTLGRTMLSMGRVGGLPKQFADVHPRYASPRFGTVAVGVAGAVVYVVMNFLSHGLVIGDAVASCGLMIALYYGLTGITAAWSHRHVRTKRLQRSILPGIGGIALVAAGVWSLKNDLNPDSGNTSWTIPGTHWEVGGVFIIGVLAFVTGFIALAVLRRTQPAFFRDGLEPLGIDDAA